MRLFLARTRLTGIQVEVDDLPRVLTAAAVMPVFGFPGWQYPTLHEGLLGRNSPYPCGSGQQYKDCHRAAGGQPNYPGFG